MSPMTKTADLASDDATLLGRYASNGSDDAFRILVQRHVDLVYNVARRKVGGDAHLAEDVVQRVFADLARKAEALSTHPALVGWLFTSAHYTATQLVRAESRRRERERKAYTMSEPNDEAAMFDGERLRPLLDDVVNDLDDRDRTAVILRFFEGLSLSEVGRRLQLTEDGARSRVDRALDKMRAILARRGISSTTAAVGLALAGHLNAAAPAGLASAVAGAAMTGGKGLLASAKIMPLVTAAIIVTGVAVTVWQTLEHRALRANVRQLQSRVAKLGMLQAEHRTLANEHAEMARLRADDAELATLEAEALRLRGKAIQLKRLAETRTRQAQSGAARANVVTVLGKVQNPAGYPLAPGAAASTLGEMIERAGGLILARPGRIRITRQEADRTLKTYTVDYPSQAAFEIKPNDYIYVPEAILGGPGTPNPK